MLLAAWARLERRVARCRQFGIMTLLLVLFFLILPTVWIQNAMMLRHLRTGGSLIGLVTSSETRVDAGADADAEGEGPRAAVPDVRPDPPPRSAPARLALGTGGFRALTPPEIGVIARLRRREGHACRPLALPDGPAWKHPRLGARHGHAAPPARGDRAVNVTAVLQYPNVAADGARRYPQAIVQRRQGGAARPATPADLEARQREYEYALARTLLHPSVAEAHLLLNDTARDLPPLLRGLAALCDLDPALAGKLRVRDVGHAATYGDAIAHANAALPPGAVALVANSDAYPVGRGWGDLRARHFAPRLGPNRTAANAAAARRQRADVLYMLSRYTPRCPPPHDGDGDDKGASEPETARAGGRRGRRRARDRWAGWSRPEMCMDMGRAGSADGFLFRVPVPARVAEEMRGIPTHYWGAENRAAAAFARAGHARIYNPCNQLALWHRHCSGVRTAGPGVPRVNRGTGRSRTAKWVSCLDEVPQ